MEEYLNKNRKILEKMIFNKNIVIVGPAPYLNSQNKGSFIDKYDIVVRCNKGHNLIENPSVFGSRTDILYHCVNQKLDNGGKLIEENLKNIKLIVGSYPLLSGREPGTSFSDVPGGTFIDYESLSKEIIINKFTSVDREEYLKFEKLLGCRPNTGIIAIKDILDLNPKSLYITGFTLFKDGYSKLYRNVIDGIKVTEENSKYFVLNRMKKEKKHNQYLICKVLKNIILNTKITMNLDKEFINILKFDPNTYKNKINEQNFTNEQLFQHFLEN